MICLRSVGDALAPVQLHGDLGFAQPSKGHEGSQDLEARLRLQHHLPAGVRSGIFVVVLLLLLPLDLGLVSFIVANDISTPRWYCGQYTR